MSLNKRQVSQRLELDLTSASTLQHLIIIGVVCSLLWIVIAATVGT